MTAKALPLLVAVLFAGCTDPYTSPPTPRPDATDDKTTIDAVVRAAARRPVDPQLAAPGTRSTVVAVADRDGTGAHRRLIVVLREDRRYRVTLATAERRTPGWAITSWEPQP